MTHLSVCRNDVTENKHYQRTSSSATLTRYRTRQSQLLRDRRSKRCREQRDGRV